MTQGDSQLRVALSLRGNFGLNFWTMLEHKTLGTLENRLSAFYIVRWLWVFEIQGQKVIVWIWNVPSAALCYILGSQMMVPFWEVVKLLRGGTQGEEVSHWGHALQVYAWSLSPFPHSLFPICHAVNSLLFHMLPPPWCSALPLVQKQQSWPW